MRCSQMGVSTAFKKGVKNNGKKWVGRLVAIDHTKPIRLRVIGGQIHSAKGDWWTNPFG